jgi:hypothetical protein
MEMRRRHPVRARGVWTYRHAQRNTLLEVLAHIRVQLSGTVRAALDHAIPGREGWK